MLTACAALTLLASPAQAVPFYVLNTEGGANFIGRIEQISEDGLTRTQVADVDPSEFGVIEHWKGFASDGD